MYQFLQKYVRGHPTIISEYMPGGGGRKVANHLYHNVKGDGLTIGASSPGILASAVLGMSGVNLIPPSLSISDRRSARITISL
jgi:hypothetical protein